MIVKHSIKELLGLETDLSEIEYSKHGLKRHLEKRKHYDVLKYVDKISDIIENPDYVGINTNGKKTGFGVCKML